jgi:hypothetical protein
MRCEGPLDTDIAYVNVVIARVKATAARGEQEAWETSRKVGFTWVKSRSRSTM